MKPPNPPRRQRRSAVAAAVIAAAALTMLTACGGGSGSGSPGVANIGASARPGSPSPSRSASNDAVAYSRCMRSHGVPTFPDPGSDGAVPKANAQQMDVSTAQFQAAQQACQSQLPATDGSFDEQERQCYGGGSCPPALVQQMLTVGRKYAGCMRSHGVPNWPDPTLDSQGRPYFDISGAGITSAQWHSTAMRAKADECGNEAGGGLATG